MSTPTSLDRKLERCAREIAEAKAHAERPRYGLTIPEPEPDMLPDGVWDAGPGVYMATCRRCERGYELPYDPADFTEDGNYCGGQPGCTP